jgi:2-dehydropantoate 2-reductase
MARVLVIGAGVIGSYLTHVLCEGGHDVSLAARGIRKDCLDRRGLVIRHFLQLRTTVDRPRIVGGIDPSVRYDAVFAVMQYQQMPAILDELARADSPLVFLVGNNLSPAEMERRVREVSRGPKTVLFGFLATGGRWEEGLYTCVRFGAGSLVCGFLHGEPDEGTKRVLGALFPGKAKPSFQADMEAWYAGHLAFVLPICYLCYALDCDLTKATGRRLSAVLDAAGEGFALLKSLGYSLPPGDESFYRPGAKRAMMSILLWIMAKTALGRLAASDHCRNASGEMRALDGAFQALRARGGEPPMPAWDALRDAMPGWDGIESRYRS